MFMLVILVELVLELNLHLVFLLLQEFKIGSIKSTLCQLGLLLTYFLRFPIVSHFLIKELLLVDPFLYVGYNKQNRPDATAVISVDRLILN